MLETIRQGRSPGSPLRLNRSAPAFVLVLTSMLVAQRAQAFQNGPAARARRSAPDAVIASTSTAADAMGASPPATVVPKAPVGTGQPAAQRTDAAWHWRAVTIAGKATWSVARSSSVPRGRATVSARRRLRDGAWEWLEIDLTRPFRSGPTAGVGARAVVRYDMVRRGLATTFGIEPSWKASGRLTLTASCRLHVVGLPDHSTAHVTHRVRFGAAARLSRRATISAVAAHEGSSGGTRLDLVLYLND